MFTRHAKFRGSEFRSVGLRRAMPRWLAAAHADDSGAGFHITVFEPSYQEHVGWGGNIRLEKRRRS